MYIVKIVEAVKLGVAMAGGTPIVFPAIAVCDGIAMGHTGMKYSLVTRDLIADSTEAMALAHGFDALVMVPNCDKNVPGLLMAAARVNVPTVFVSGGPMLAGRVEGKKTSLSSMFEAVGAYNAGRIDDKKLLEDFFKELQSCEALDDVLEEMSILSTDDLPYIVMMILRSLSNLRPTHTELKVPAKFKSDEDPAFVKTLFEKSLVTYSAFQDYIEKFTANWDVERIVFIDNLIIGTAMAELTSFPSIPVKVTLDEWIEISKYYSTPGSSTFINGVLDKIVESHTAEGSIKKAGRGLIE